MTIQIFIPDGDPRSVRIAKITSRTIQVIEIPRMKLHKVAERREVKQVGVYFLFGDEEDNSKPKVYIGESENCYDRLLQHHRDKDFWTRAVAVTSNAMRFDKAQARWLERYAIREATRAGRFTVENKVDPSEPYINEPIRIDLIDAFVDLKTLTDTLGFPIFEEKVPPDAKYRTFFCRGHGAKGMGEHLEDGFLVLKGSRASNTETMSVEVNRIRDRVRRARVVIDTDTHYYFVSDYLFSSPSAAAMFVLGYRANGWKEWKDFRGRTLDELKR